MRLGRRGEDEVDALRRAYGQALDAGDAAGAERLARRVVELDPADSGMWFDLALGAKRRRDWAVAAELNARALGLLPDGREEPAAWNLGIAATALGDWAGARRAWTAYGLTVPGGEGPLHVPGLGAVPVRLNPPGSGPDAPPDGPDDEAHEPEVVWALRLSPAHARLVNVPSPGSGHRWGDVVLTDGVPQGERHDGRQWVPVFDELEVLERSRHPTWTVEVTATGDDDTHELTRRAHQAGLAAEDWTRNVRILCAACSEGRPADHHHGDAAGWSDRRTVGLAGAGTALVRLLDAWAGAAAGRDHQGLRRVG